VQALAKAGTLFIIGVYPLTDKSFPIGMAMNKNLTINMGNCNHRKYVPMLVDLYSGPLCQDSEADVKTQNADPSPSLKSSPVVASGCVPAYTSAGVR